MTQSASYAHRAQNSNTSMQGLPIHKRSLGVLKIVVWTVDAKYNRRLGGHYTNFRANARWRLRKHKGGFFIASWSTSGTIFGKNEIEEHFSKKCYNQDKMHFYAKMTFSNISWLQPILREYFSFVVGFVVVSCLAGLWARLLFRGCFSLVCCFPYSCD